mmetsp:Transcript_30271/g.69787  ORF Transcript_30271/g.69787 Transcript_30271/m.69787 type:complete len:178 (-) Transcript_30271:190-723(-)
MLHVASEDKRAQTCGAVVVTNNAGTLPVDCSRKHEKHLWSFVREGLPIRIRAIHCCYATSMEFFLPMVKQLIGRDLRQRFVVHGARNRTELLGSLQDYGLQRSGLPEVLGGRFYLDPARWVQERMVMSHSNCTTANKLPSRGGDLLEARRNRSKKGGALVQDSHICRGYSAPRFFKA